MKNSIVVAFGLPNVTVFLLIFLLLIFTAMLLKNYWNRRQLQIMALSTLETVNHKYTVRVRFGPMKGVGFNGVFSIDLFDFNDKLLNSMKIREKHPFRKITKDVNDVIVQLGSRNQLKFVWSIVVDMDRSLAEPDRTYLYGIIVEGEHHGQLFFPYHNYIATGQSIEINECQLKRSHVIIEPPRSGYAFLRSFFILYTSVASIIFIFAVIQSSMYGKNALRNYILVGIMNGLLGFCVFIGINNVYDRTLRRLEIKSRLVHPNFQNASFLAYVMFLQYTFWLFLASCSLAFLVGSRFILKDANDLVLLNVPYVQIFVQFHTFDEYWIYSVCIALTTIILLCGALTKTKYRRILK